VLSVTDEQTLMARAQRRLGFFSLSADDLLKLYECECEGLEEPDHLLKRVFGGSVEGSRALAVLDLYKESKDNRLGLSEFGLFLLYLCTDLVDNQAAYLGKGLGFLNKYSGEGLTEEQRRGYLSAVRGILHKYKLVVIDEVQDLNVAQHKFLELVFGTDAGVPSATKVVFVGDDDQCIYEWRFSNVDLMRQAPFIYGLKTVYMTKSYRCCDEIMQLGERILNQCDDKGRWEKPLEGRGEHGTVKEIGARCQTLKTRVDAFARILCAYEFSEEIGSESAAVLMRYRSSALPVLLHLYDLENAASGIPEERFHSVYMLDGEFRAEKGIRDLRLVSEAVMSYDKPSVAYDKVLPLMGTYLRAEERQKILGYMDEYSVNLFELPFFLLGEKCPAPYGKERSEEELTNIFACMKFAKNGMYAPTVQGLTKLATLYHNLTKVGKELNDFYVARYFFSLCVPDEKNTKLVTPAIASGHIRGQVVYDWAVKHIAHLENEPTSKKGKVGFRTILDVLSRVEDRYTTSATATVKKGRLRVRTVHSAKGLQWDTVFFLDADTTGSGAYDMEAAATKEGSGNEEVRINYVGVTRARNRLIV
jgi:superfamily I DNA/RNA helicase